ncbi:MAG: hypothetical protein ACI4IF_08250 [Acutalibacteraceae bacterium]
MNLKKFFNLQLFSDGSAAAENTGDTVADAEQTNGADEEFEQLISGKFKEQFHKRTQEIIDKRFKETKLLEDYKNSVSENVNKLLEKYGLEAGDEEKLFDTLINSENGVKESDFESPSDENEKNEAEARRIRLGNKAKLWVEESKSLKELYPEFDLRNELKNNELFAQLLLAGAPLRASFETSHKDEILGGAMKYAATKAREQVVKNIETKGRRPLENGVSSESAVVTSVDVNSLSSKDILKILKQVENGANIKF